jgi:hypothetical protein
MVHPEDNQDKDQTQPEDKPDMVPTNLSITKKVNEKEG